MMLAFRDSIILFFLFASICIISVSAVRPVSTYGHHMPSTSSKPSSHTNSASSRSPGRLETVPAPSSSSPKNGKGSKHDPIDIDFIIEKHSPHHGKGSRTDPIRISDLGERTRPIEISDSQHSTSPVRHTGYGHRATTSAAGGSNGQQSLYASKKRPYGKSTASVLPGNKRARTSASKRGGKGNGNGSGTQLIDQWLNFKAQSSPKNT